jgi:hypothetical protein
MGVPLLLAAEGTAIIRMNTLQSTEDQNVEDCILGIN